MPEPRLARRVHSFLAAQYPDLHVRLVTMYGHLDNWTDLLVVDDFMVTVAAVVPWRYGSNYGNSCVAAMNARRALAAAGFAVSRADMAVSFTVLEA